MQPSEVERRRIERKRGVKNNAGGKKDWSKGMIKGWWGGKGWSERTTRAESKNVREKAGGGFYLEDVESRKISSREKKREKQEDIKPA